MMNVEEQIQSLIDHAPPDGQTPDLIQAIGPGLIQLAQQLRHPQYFILQSREQQWLTTILSNRGRPDQEKTVIYAYPTLQDAQRSIAQGDRRHITPAPLAVIHLLFQFIALPSVDSLLFFERPDDRGHALEVKRSELQDLVKSHLQRYKQQHPTPPFPPNVA